MGSYSTTGKVERYQDLMRIVHSNKSVSPLLVLRQSAPYIGFLSQSTISYLAKTLLVLCEQERLFILSSHADMPLVLWPYFMYGDNGRAADRARYPMHRS